MSFVSNIHFAPLILYPRKTASGTFWSANFSASYHDEQTTGAAVFLEAEKLVNKEWRQAEMQIRHEGYNPQGRDKEGLIAALKSQTKLPADTLEYFRDICKHKEERFFTKFPGYYSIPLKGQKPAKEDEKYIAESKKSLDSVLATLPPMLKNVYSKENTQFCIFPAMEEVRQIICFNKHSKEVMIAAQHVPKNEKFDEVYRKKFRLSMCEEAIHIADNALGISSNLENRTRMQAYWDKDPSQHPTFDDFYKTLYTRNIVLENTDKGRIYIMQPHELLAHMVLLKQDITEEVTAAQTRKTWRGTIAANPAMVEALVTERLQQCLTPDMLSLIHEFETAVKNRYTATGAGMGQKAGS